MLSKIDNFINSGLGWGGLLRHMDDEKVFVAIINEAVDTHFENVVSIFTDLLSQSSTLSYQDAYSCLQNAEQSALNPFRIHINNSSISEVEKSYLLHEIGNYLGRWQAMLPAAFDQPDTLQTIFETDGGIEAFFNRYQAQTQHFITSLSSRLSLSLKAEIDFAGDILPYIITSPLFSTRGTVLFDTTNTTKSIAIKPEMALAVSLFLMEAGINAEKRGKYDLLIRFKTEKSVVLIEVLDFGGGLESGGTFVKSTKFGTGNLAKLMGSNEEKMTIQNHNETHRYLNLPPHGVKISVIARGILST